VKKYTTRARRTKAVVASFLLVPLLFALGGCWLLTAFNEAPTAAFTISSQAGQAPFAVNFSAVLSEDEDGTIITFEWDFGDGSSGSGENVTHTYTSAGTFTVVLRVTDDDGDTGTNNKKIYVSPAEAAGPTASFSLSPNSGTSPMTVFFNAAASVYPDGVIQAYEWAFGDGSTGFGSNPSHTYFSAGSQTYTVTLVVRGTDGKTGTATGTVTITAAGGGTGTTTAGDPSARFDIVSDSTRLAAGATGVAPYQALFDPEDTEVDDGQALLQLIWSFGDGESATTANIVEQWHTYTTTDPSETFSVTLVAMDNEAATDSITKTVKVYNHKPVAGFEIANPLGGHIAGDTADDEEYATRAAAVAGDRWDDDDDNDGVLLGDLQNLAGATVTVWLRSLVVDEGVNDVDDYETDWFNLVVPQTLVGAVLTDDQDDLAMAEGTLAAPGSTKPKPNDYDTFEDAFSYDPEGQSWADRGAANDTSDDYPDWFPNQAWGIQWIYVDWDDGTGEEAFDYRAATDSTVWAGGTTLPAYDQDFIVSHAYAFAGGTATKTITIRVVDFLGAEATFSRDVIFMEGQEGSDDLDP
jgi:PKD repeat protein